MFLSICSLGSAQTRQGLWLPLRHCGLRPSCGDRKSRRCLESGAFALPPAAFRRFPLEAAAFEKAGETFSGWLSMARPSITALYRYRAKKLPATQAIPYALKFFLPTFSFK